MDHSKKNKNQNEAVLDSIEREVDWNSLDFGENMQGVLRQNIRNDLVASLKKNAPERLDDSLSAKMTALVHKILQSKACQSDALSSDFESLFLACNEIYERTDIPRMLRRRRYICATGLVISPDHCTTTIKDIKRVYAFIKGVDQALQSLVADTDGPVHIVYPACGPFAPLLLPLLSYYQKRSTYTNNQLKVTLIDIQQGAVLSLQALVSELNLNSYIEEITCCNAVEFRTHKPVHMVVLEALQHGFSREGHLRIAKHFADMLQPSGIFIPQEIVITAALNVPQREYVDQWQRDLSDQGMADTQYKVQQERTPLGEILRVNLSMLQNMEIIKQDEHTSLYECGLVQIPDMSVNGNKQVLMIQSDIQVFDQWGVGEYESGITHPLPDLSVCINFEPLNPEPDDLLIKSGEHLQFYYCMNGLPGFLPLKVESYSQNTTSKPQHKGLGV